MTTPPAESGWLGTDGWCPQAQRLSSPNFGQRPPHTAIDLIVVHSISMPPGVYGGQDVQALFTNRLDWDAHPFYASIRGLEVSAHFYIARDGKLWQFVDCDDRAWHAGQSCYLGRSNCNDHSIGIELEGKEGQLFEPAQYRALAQLCLRLRARYPIQQVAGHEHIAPGRKGDPGCGFDWPLLQQLTAWPANSFPLPTAPAQAR